MLEQILILIFAISIIIFLGLRGYLLAERILIGICVLIQFVLFVSSWGDFHNVHGGFIALIFIALIGLIVFLGEIILALIKPSKWRAIQILVASVPAVFFLLWGSFSG
jgi:hypothetical protein